MSNESNDIFKIDFSMKSNELKYFYKGSINTNTMLSLKSANSMSI